MRTARVLAVANQKGGVGKTTTSINLAASIAATERRVLLVDLDPQGNASSGVGVGRAQIGDGPTIYDVLAGRSTLAETARSTELASLSVAPSTTDLAGAEIELATEERREFRLREMIDRARGDFDYIVIDTPPSLGLLTLNALVAADGVLVPMQCEYYALEGLSHLLATIERVRARLNPRLVLEGIVFCMHDPRQNLTNQVVGEVKSHFADKVYETVIPRNVRLGEAPSFGKPILLYDVASRGSQSYLALAREFLERTEPEVKDGAA
jgi:chromosome partitioning protein